MSEFDKEAERERLREKYERDREKRQATEKMSELLLQGATMTNAHCSDCNDPIFRYDGQEFCATCEKPIQRETGDEQTDGEDESGAAIEVTTPSDDARVSFGGESADDGVDSGAETPREPEPEPDSERDEETRRVEPGQSERAEVEESERDELEDSEPRSEAPAPGQRSATPEPGGSDAVTVDAARELLVRTLVEFSERAAASDDPRQARDNLAAAREAAETLAALRR